MKMKSIALLGLALACGLVAAIGVTQVIAKPGKDTSGDEKTVFVATQQIQHNVKITPQMLRIENWPADKIPEGAVTNIEDIEGRYPVRTLDAGDPIRETKLMPKGASPSGVVNFIPKGYRLIGVKVDQVSAGKLLQPGDRVDLVVFLAKNTSQGVDTTSAFTFLRNVKVFAVDGDYKADDGPNNEEDGNKPGGNSGNGTVRLLVTPRQAELTMLASELGKIRFVQRGADPDEPSDEENNASDSRVTLDQLTNKPLEGNEKAEKQENPIPGFNDLMARIDAQAAKNRLQQPPVSKEPEKYVTRLIEGSNVKDVIMVNEHLPGGAIRPRWVPEEFNEEESGSSQDNSQRTPEEESLDSDRPGFMSADAMKAGSENALSAPQPQTLFEQFQAKSEEEANYNEAKRNEALQQSEAKQIEANQAEAKQSEAEE